jgi:hypothetical protein
LLIPFAIFSHSANGAKEEYKIGLLLICEDLLSLFLRLPDFFIQAGAKILGQGQTLPLQLLFS